MFLAPEHECQTFWQFFEFEFSLSAESQVWRVASVMAADIFRTPVRRMPRHTATWRNASDLHFRVRRPSFWLQMSILPITFCVYRARQSHYRRGIQQTDCVGFAALWLFILRDFHHCRRTFNKSEFAIDVRRELFILFRRVCRCFFPTTTAGSSQLLAVSLEEAENANAWMNVSDASSTKTWPPSGTHSLLDTRLFIADVNTSALPIISTRRFMRLSKTELPFYDSNIILLTHP